MESSLPERPHDVSVHAPVRLVSVVAAVSIAAVALASGVWIAAADNQSTELRGGAAAKFAPEDGHVEWILGDDGALRMYESARSIGFNHIVQLPLAARSSTIRLLGDDSSTAQLWRESDSMVSGGDQGQTSLLHLLSGEGISLVAEYGGGIAFTYSPALLELPADVAPGSVWSSAGTAHPDGLLTYTASYTASPPTLRGLITASQLGPAELASCIQTDGGSVYRDMDGEILLEITESNLWCEGRGRVAIVGTVNGYPVVQGPPATSPSVASTGAAVAPLNWSSADSWHVATAESRYADAFFGEQPFPVSLANGPQRTESGLIVAANQNGDDLVALRLEGDVLERQWFAHPGGEITALTTAGDVTIVTTSQRRVVAYSIVGLRLWSMDCPELVLAAPTDARNGNVIIVGLDGTVSSVNSLSGEVDWERKIAADVSLAPVVVGGSVVVVDRAGAINAFDRETGETAWSHDTGQPATFLIGAEGVMTVAGSDGFLRTFDAASGKHLWTLKYLGTLHTAVQLGSHVVFVTNEATTAVDATSGTVRWTQGGARDAVTDGDRIVVFDESTARIVDETGAIGGVWDIPSLALSIYRFALPGVNGFWVFRSNAPTVLVGQP